MWWIVLLGDRISCWSQLGWTDYDLGGLNLTVWGIWMWQWLAEICSMYGKVRACNFCCCSDWPLSGLPLLHFCAAITDSDNTDKDSFSGTAIKLHVHLLILHAVCKEFTERMCICRLYQNVSGKFIGDLYSVELSETFTTFSVAFREGIFQEGWCVNVSNTDKRLLWVKWLYTFTIRVYIRPSVQILLWLFRFVFLPFRMCLFPVTLGAKLSLTVLLMYSGSG